MWILIRINYKRNTDRRKQILATKQTYGDPYTLNSRNASKSSGIDGRFKGITDTHSASTNYYNQQSNEIRINLHAAINYANENHCCGMFTFILTT